MTALFSKTITKSVVVSLLFFLVSSTWATAILINNPELRRLFTNNISMGGLQSSLEQICDGVVTHHQHFAISSPIPDAIYDVQSHLLHDLKYVCGCSVENPDLQASLLGALYIKNTVKDNTKASKFLKINLRRIARQCIWQRHRNAEDNYVSYYDKESKYLLDKCQSDYTQALLGKRVQTRKPSVEQVLSTSKQANKVCQCVLNSSMLRGVSTIAIELLTAELVGEAEKDIDWQVMLLGKRLNEQVRNCDIQFEKS